MFNILWRHYFIQESEKIIAELNETWEEKLRKTEQIRQQRWVSTHQPDKKYWFRNVKKCSNN